MADPIPALTVYQPWASLIAAGAKPYEWRGWEAPRRLIGRRIAIHAGARKVQFDEIAWLIRALERNGEPLSSLRSEIALPLLRGWFMQPSTLPLASVLCTAVLGPPITALDYARKIGFSPADSDRIEHTKWGWPLTDIEVLQPFVPACGAQGFWRWTPPDG